MQTFYDTEIKPLSDRLDKLLGIKRIPVRYVEPEPTDGPVDYHVTVVIKGGDMKLTDLPF